MAGVDWRTILFFIGLFVCVGGLEETGVLNALADFIGEISGGSIVMAITVILWVSAFASAVVDNIPYVATMIPLIQDLAVKMGAADVKPLWWALSLGACLGGNATIIGASANVIVAGISAKNGHRISFFEFTKYGLVVTLVNLALSTVFVLLTP